MSNIDFQVEQKIRDDYRKWFTEWRKDSYYDEQTGQEYSQSYDGNLIFIDAPTGSGKTTFILKTLLPYFCALKKKILYLVNRRILKKQIQEMISYLPHAQTTAITVELYQKIEKKITESAFSFDEKEGMKTYGYDYSKLQELSVYDCVVCDECHYFLTDSNYNTNTVFSFQWIRDTFWNKGCIFMSATIREVQSYIEEKNPFKYDEAKEYIETPYYEIPKYKTDTGNLLHDIEIQRGESAIIDWRVKRYKITPYQADRNYDYIKDTNIRIIKEREEIINLVAEGDHKWIIFIDNINYGKRLESAIKRKLRESIKETAYGSIDDKVRMISSGYKRDQKSTEEVDRIIRTSVPLAKILIVTSVLDNGINIKDIDVRNIILFADTETEFIQMLGRKRKDTHQIQLYIYGYNHNHFCRRLQQLNKAKKMADRYWREVADNIDALKKADDNNSLSWAKEPNKGRVFECERKCIEFQHKELMQELMNNYIQFDDVKKVFTGYDGKWLLNLLSLHNIENLIRHYLDIIEKFENEGEDAFVREQLRWLGKTGEVAEKIIRESKQDREEKSRERVRALLEKIKERQMIKEEYIKYTDEILADLRVLVAHPVDFPNETDRTNDQFKRWGVVKREFNKRGKALSKQSMEFLREFCRIPYQVTTDRNGVYRVQRVD